MKFGRFFIFQIVILWIALSLMRPILSVAVGGTGASSEIDDVLKTLVKGYMEPESVNNAERLADPAVEEKIKRLLSGDPKQDSAKTKVLRNLYAKKDYYQNLSRDLHECIRQGGGAGFVASQILAGSIKCNAVFDEIKDLAQLVSEQNAQLSSKDPQKQNLSPGQRLAAFSKEAHRQANLENVAAEARLAKMYNVPRDQEMDDRVRKVLGTRNSKNNLVNCSELEDLTGQCEKVASSIDASKLKTYDLGEVSKEFSQMGSRVNECIKRELHLASQDYKGFDARPRVNEIGAPITPVNHLNTQIKLASEAAAKRIEFCKLEKLYEEKQLGLNGSKYLSELGFKQKQFSIPKASDLMPKYESCKKSSTSCEFEYGGYPTSIKPSDLKDFVSQNKTILAQAREKLRNHYRAINVEAGTSDDDHFKDLFLYNPQAVGRALANHPEMIGQLCDQIKRYVASEKNYEEKLSTLSLTGSAMVLTSGAMFGGVALFPPAAPLVAPVAGTLNLSGALVSFGANALAFKYYSEGADASKASKINSMSSSGSIPGLKSFDEEAAQEFAFLAKDKSGRAGHAAIEAGEAFVMSGLAYGAILGGTLKAGLSTENIAALAGRESGNLRTARNLDGLLEDVVKIRRSGNVDALKPVLSGGYGDISQASAKTKSVIQDLTVAMNQADPGSKARADILIASIKKDIKFLKESDRATNEGYHQLGELIHHKLHLAEKFLTPFDLAYVTQATVHSLADSGNSRQ